MQKLVDIEEALHAQGIAIEEYMEMVEDLQEYLEEYFPEIENYIERDNLSGVQETCHTLVEALDGLKFLAASEVASRLEKSGKMSSEDPVALLREFKQVFRKSLKAVGAA